MRPAETYDHRLLRRVAIGALLVTAVVLAGAVVAGSGVAAANAKPVNTSLPTISGTAQEGRTLTASPGSWSGSTPITYVYFWRRCDTAGGSCVVVTRVSSQTYTLSAKDVGRTLRVGVTAKNSDGSGWALSSATAVVGQSGAPSNTSLPTISGTAQEGKALTGNRGAWTNNPTRYDYSWLRCDKKGGSCGGISGAHNTLYTLTSADVQSTLRFRVSATNSAGSTSATSAATAVATGVTPSRGAGCPSGGGNPDQVANIASPARLLIDSLSSNPQVVPSGVTTLIVRFHVTSTCGGPVQGALVYATATPYNQFSIPPEAPTGADGWAELRFQRLAGFPVGRHQQLIALFVRARKSGENLLAGISTRRLVSVRVDLNR